MWLRVRGVVKSLPLTDKQTEMRSSRRFPGTTLKGSLVLSFAAGNTTVYPEATYYCLSLMNDSSQNLLCDFCLNVELVCPCK
jgi:hypothetical protein